jgi:hypothetical protein
MDGWNALCRVPWDRDHLTAASAEFTGFNCGIVIDAEHVVLDVDISDPDLAETVNTVLVETFTTTPLMRIGRAPRSAHLYRTSGPIHGRKLHPIEVMSNGGQLVAFGTHPDTGCPYEWIGEYSPLTLAADSKLIPAVTEQQIAQFLTEAGRLLTRAHYVAPRRTHGRQQANPGFLSVRQRLRIDATIMGFERAAARLLQTAIDGSERRHITMFEVVSAAIGRGWDEARIVRLFEQYFAGWNGVTEAAFHRVLIQYLRED